MEYEFRAARPGEEDRIMEIIGQARQLMHDEGRAQWDGEYPAMHHILGDISRREGRVMVEDGRIIAYAAVIFTGEPVYNDLEGGEWLSDRPYVVVHRLAVAREARRRGVAAHFMQEVERLALSREVHSFRVDTNHDNSYMLKVLFRLHFTHCGTVRYPQGSRLAFEKLIFQ